jgi:hypothetical protein
MARVNRALKRLQNGAGGLKGAGSGHCASVRASVEWRRVPWWSTRWQSEGNLTVLNTGGGLVKGTILDLLCRPLPECREFLRGNQGVVTGSEGVTIPVEVFPRIWMPRSNDLDRTDSDGTEEVGAVAGFSNQVPASSKRLGGSSKLTVNTVTTVCLEQDDISKGTLDAVFSDPVQTPVTSVTERGNKTRGLEEGHLKVPHGFNGHTLAQNGEKAKGAGGKNKKSTGGDVDPMKNKKGQRKRCRSGSKAVNAACVRKAVLVAMQLPQVLQDDLSYARDYLMVLPQRIKEVQQAADAVLRAGARQ